MKKIAAVLMVCLAVLSLCSCGALTDESGDTTMGLNGDSAMRDNSSSQNGAVGNEVFIFTWLSYTELAVTGERNTEKSYRQYINGLFDNMKTVGITDCFVHVRPFADAMYDSELFPLSRYASGASFEPLKLILAEAKDFGVTVHGWINPYRILSSGSMEDLPESSVARRWYEAKNGSVIEVAGGYYFNPASPEVQKLILDGARELLENYDIGGIHIDDYFYPPEMENQDSAEYAAYREKGGKLSLADWRRENISALVSSLYSLVKSFPGDKIFSVSPGGDIDRDYHTLYADVYKWCAGGYADMILPQIYYGFENETLPFEQCLEQWLAITDSSKVCLVPGLALYKAGQADPFAGKGEREWQENSDIISRQAACVLAKPCGGFALYSASYINFSKTFLLQELNRLKTVL